MTEANLDRRFSGISFKSQQFGKSNDLNVLKNMKTKDNTHGNINQLTLPMSEDKIRKKIKLSHLLSIETVIV
jgi:hypothetical protein